MPMETVLATRGDEALCGQGGHQVAFAPLRMETVYAHGDSSLPSHGDEALYGQVPYPVAFAP